MLKINGAAIAPTHFPATSKPGLSLDGLSSTAKTLSAASRRLNAAIEQMNGAFKKLNLGITAWVTSSVGEESFGVSEWEEIGYARYKGTWGVCLRQIVEGHSSEPEVTTWHFDDAPRDMRVRGAECLNQLVEKLNEIAQETTDKITQRANDAEELATTITAIAEETRGTANLRPKGGK